FIRYEAYCLSRLYLKVDIYDRAAYALRLTGNKLWLLRPSPRPVVSQGTTRDQSVLIRKRIDAAIKRKRHLYLTVGRKRLCRTCGVQRRVCTLHTHRLGVL